MSGSNKADRHEIQLYQGHSGELSGVAEYGNHCKTTEATLAKPGSELERSVVRGITHLLQDYIRRGVCRVLADEWDERIIVEIVVYDDIVRQARYKTVRRMFPHEVTKCRPNGRRGKVPLPKRIDILVALGSKDSVEYKQSEEYRKEHANVKPYQTITIREDEKDRLRIVIGESAGGYTVKQKRLMDRICKCIPKSAEVTFETLPSAVKA